jgi:hypothetical protein
VQEEFASWYSNMSFQEDASFTEKRWNAIYSQVKDLTAGRLALLARLAFRLKQPMGVPEVAELRTALSGDATPPGDEELIMLSASALAAAMESESDDVTALAATIVACTACGGLRELKQPMDLVGLSNNALRRLSETSRRRPSLEQAKLVTPAVDKTDLTAMEQAFAEGDVPKAVQAVVSGTNKALSAMARRQRDFEAAVRKYVNIQDEELDILWWLEGKYSFDLGLDFSDASPQHRPLAIARELAGLTKVLPGPPALSALLSRTGVQDAEPESISDAVQGMPVDWLIRTVESLVAGRISATLTPILFAMQRRHEVDGKDDWIAVWCTMTSLTREAKMEPLQLAAAAYREFSLARLG